MLSPESGANQTSWQGFILMGSRYQLYTATFQERCGVILTQIELVNANNQSIFIGLDEDDSGDPNPPDPVIEYSQLNSNGIQQHFLNDEDCHHIVMHHGSFPVYYLLSHSFHQLLNRIIFTGKSINVHLINPLSPDNNADFHLTLNQTGNSYTVAANPINSEGQIQYANNAMLFHHVDGLNWGYYIAPTLIAAASRLLFFQHRLFEMGNTFVAAMLLSLFTPKPSLLNR